MVIETKTLALIVNQRQMNHELRFNQAPELGHICTIHIFSWLYSKLSFCVSMLIIHANI